jgi:hypothetical protein
MRFGSCAVARRRPGLDPDHDHPDEREYGARRVRAGRRPRGAPGVRGAASWRREGRGEAGLAAALPARALHPGGRAEPAFVHAPDAWAAERACER